MAATPRGEVLVYEAPDGGVWVDVRLEHDTVWLTQRQMAELFDTSTDNVGLRLKNIFSDGELSEAATTEDLISDVLQLHQVPRGTRSAGTSGNPVGCAPRTDQWRSVACRPRFGA